MLATSVIAKKRDGHVLSPKEIQFIVRGITDGSLPDYQTAAWAMAVLCRGMTTDETAAFTDAMLDSGKRLQPASEKPRVDKHSTGGLGDKVSLILAPLLACFDVDVPMLSGRGLGITGGTLDKLEAYPGYRTDLSESEIATQLAAIGCVITGTTEDIAPADRKLYLLRDATATVPSIPLITGSIMSKKLAAALDALVLDVKFGSASFMQEMEPARQLAASLVSTGQRMRVKTDAILSDMNQPLGQMVGNACEANEAVQILQGGGPADVRQLTLALCSKLLVSVMQYADCESATTALASKLDSGAALDRYIAMLEAQGGQYCESLPLAPPHVCTATQAGWVSHFDGQSLGQLVIELGGGRQKLGDSVDHKVGLQVLVRVGDRIEAGQPLARVFARRAADLQRVKARILEVIHVSAAPTPALQLIHRL